MAALKVGDRVRTPEGREGIVMSLGLQAEPHGGWRSVGAGLGPKRARPGELEELRRSQQRTYAHVVFSPGKFANYNADVLEVIG